MKYPELADNLLKLGYNKKDDGKGNLFLYNEKFDSLITLSKFSPDKNVEQYLLQTVKNDILYKSILSEADFEKMFIAKKASQPAAPKAPVVDPIIEKLKSTPRYGNMEGKIRSHINVQAEAINQSAKGTANKYTGQRRMPAVTRVFISKGDGNVIINDRDYKAYFPLKYLQNQVELPLKTIEATDKYDVVINATGGGIKGQAEAAKLGIARALLALNPEFRPALKAAGLLHRDPTGIERKIPGKKKARKRSLFTKR